MTEKVEFLKWPCKAGNKWELAPILYKNEKIVKNNNTQIKAKITISYKGNKIKNKLNSVGHKKKHNLILKIRNFHAGLWLNSTNFVFQTPQTATITCWRSCKCSVWENYSVWLHAVVSAGKFKTNCGWKVQFSFSSAHTLIVFLK